MNILKHPDMRLHEVSEEVESFGPDFQKLVTDMTWTLMAIPSGIGLAAIQVGIPLRVMVYQTKRGTFTSLVNPEILDRKGTPTAGYEGCLSLPGKLVGVFRHDRVQVRFMDRTGNNEETQWFIGYAARIIQHEIDHMNGILINDLNEEVKA